MLNNLKRSTKRLLALLTLLPAAVLVLGMIYMLGMDPVSYTHLDVYKRQLPHPRRHCHNAGGGDLCSGTPREPMRHGRQRGAGTRWRL